jgi:hypothetical protein
MLIEIGIVTDGVGQEHKKGNQIIYKPIPRDRDQAFSSDGLYQCL